MPFPMIEGHSSLQSVLYFKKIDIHRTESGRRIKRLPLACALKPASVKESAARSRSVLQKRIEACSYFRRQLHVVYF
ncbi:hypothetical protein PO124_29490, partial [Bacillus licheniformis]|nr:hypothetical protein [Bacillus licheniformis]